MESLINVRDSEEAAIKKGLGWSWLLLCLPTANNSHLADENNRIMSSECNFQCWKRCVQSWWYSWPGRTVVIYILPALLVNGDIHCVQSVLFCSNSLSKFTFFFQAKLSNFLSNILKQRETESSTLVTQELQFTALEAGIHCRGFSAVWKCEKEESFQARSSAVKIIFVRWP